MLTIAQITEFVRHDYATKDFMHDLSHIERVYTLAQQLGLRHPHDPEVLLASAYFHGVVYIREAAIRDFLASHGLEQPRIERIISAAYESQKEGSVETIEGRLLHDAHLLEGGKTFLITKSLVVGTLRGQTLPETMRYIEHHVLGKFKCYLPESQPLYAEKERFAAEYLADLKAHLELTQE